MMRWAAIVLLLLPMVACKVPIYPVNARFKLADASWFEEEETLFLFWDVRAEQGLGDPSVIEVTWTTDVAGEVPWTPVDQLETVHKHVEVDCGVNALCGSTSIAVPDQPRNVRLRLRYHRDGALALPADPVFNIVPGGQTHIARSLLVYGVFDELNERIQWRTRHTFPTLRNMKVSDLGLRRKVTIRDQTFGPLDDGPPPANPYGYGRACSDAFFDANLPPLTFDTRAAFHPDRLPVAASAASAVCARATVEDALGPFTANALARKNPETRAAFPTLRSPIEDATVIEYFMGPCDRTISSKHEEMQRQRLLLGNLPTRCIEGWETDEWVQDLAIELRDVVDAERANGRDMVLSIALHQDETGVAQAVEAALAEVVPQERFRSSPRLAGAFVFDSKARGIATPELLDSVLWCPSALSRDATPTASLLSCAAAPALPEIDLGPFSFGNLPILPGRERYLTFIEDFGVGQAGEVQELHFLVPEFPVTSRHIPLGEFGSVTFLNGERIDAGFDDAFSYCVQDDPGLYVFGSTLLESYLIGPDECYYLGIPDEICSQIGLGAAPLELLPDWHNQVRESSYSLGVWWEFPFLLQMEYRATLAGNISAFGFSVPFGFASPGEEYLGTQIWTADEFDLSTLLLQCERFCDFPTFDSAGVYHVRDTFRATYASECYRPRHPSPLDGGFPLDP